MVNLRLSLADVRCVERGEKDPPLGYLDIGLMGFDLRRDAKQNCIEVGQAALQLWNMRGRGKSVGRERGPVCSGLLSALAK